MSRRPALFTEADLRRAAKVAKELGLAVEVLTDGTIRIIPFGEPIELRPKIVENVEFVL